MQRINEKYNNLDLVLGQSVLELTELLDADKNRGYLKQDKYDSMIENLSKLADATAALDIDSVKKLQQELKEQCSYSRILLSKWTAIGLGVGAVVEGAAMLAVSVVSKGAAIPLWAICLNIAAGAGVGSCIGVLYGHKINEWKAKRKIDHFVGHSIFHFFEKNNHPRSQELDNSWRAFFKKQVKSDEAKPTTQNVSYASAKLT